MNHYRWKQKKKFDARLGVYEIDTSTNWAVTYRLPNERFVYVSTIKALVAGALLLQYQIDKLDEVITYTKYDLVEYLPITEKHVDSGMTLGEIAEAAIRYSDNTAGTFYSRN